MSATPQAFATLAFLYLVTNARVGSGLRRRPVQRVMTRPEREAVTEVLERLPATVADWSDGLAILEPMHIVEVRRPLNSLSSSGKDQWWAGPRDCREELLEHATERRYDSVLVLWPSVPGLSLCGWGCTVGPSEATLGAGFTSIASDHWPTLATDPDPEQGYVHEWLHQVEAIYRALGVDEDLLPGLHAAGDFTSTRARTEPPFGGTYAEYHDGVPGRPAARTWAPWYRDWMTGRVRRVASAEAGPGPDRAEASIGEGRPLADGPAHGDASLAGEAPPLGLTPERWALRSG